MTSCTAAASRARDLRPYLVFLELDLMEQIRACRSFLVWCVDLPER
jgi:hypothetical protein